MWTRTSRKLIAATLTAVCVTTAGVAAEAGAAAKRATPASSLRSLVHQTKTLPRSAGSKKQRGQLVRAANRAPHNAAGHPCVAVSALNGYRRSLGRIHVRKTRRASRASLRLAALGPASLEASRLLLASKRT